MDKVEIQSILSRRHETLDFEIKEWLDLNSENEKSTLIKAICALANHGGGHLLVGCDDAPPHTSHSCPDSIDISKYEQNYINGIIKAHLEPAIHIDLYQGKIENNPHFIIKVPFNFDTPVRINDKGDDKIWDKNKYFIRKEGPKSEPPLTGKEWDDFLNAKMLLKKSDLLASIERLIKGTNTEITNPDEPFMNWVAKNLKFWETKNPKKDNMGYYWMAFKLNDFSFSLLNDIVNTLSSVKTYTGWPPFFFQHNGTTVGGDNVETYTDYKGIGHHREYWKISKAGYFFIVHVFQEDAGDFTLQPNTPDIKFMDYALPILRTAERLLFAFQVASKNDVEKLRIQFGWGGLEDRLLGHRYFTGSNTIHITPETPKAIIPEYRTPIYNMDTEDMGINLKDNVYKILKPFYEQFNLTNLNETTVSSQIDQFFKGI